MNIGHRYTIVHKRER